MPQISIIVPVYKVEPYLRRCVDSILAQTFTDFELILVDDGSPDGSGAICDEYILKDSRVRVIHKPNGGVSTARNTGLDALEGEYITFIDSDDWVDETYLYVLYKLIIDNQVLCSVCGFSVEYDDRISEMRTNTDVIVSAPENFYGKYFMGYTVVSLASPWAMLYNKKLFEGIRYPVGKIYEDRFIAHKLLFQCEKLVVCNVNLYKYYQSENSIIRSKWKPKNLEMFEAFEEELKYYSDNNYKQAYLRTLKQYLKIQNLELIKIKEAGNYEAEYRDLRKKQKKDLRLYAKQCGISLIKEPYCYINQYPLASKTIMLLYAIKNKLFRRS